MEVHQRERKVDLDKMSTEQVESISVQVGDKVRQICDEAVEKANQILKIYGMNCKMQIVIEGAESPKQEAPKKKRGRPKKQSFT